MRARVLTFIASLMVLVVLPIANWIQVWIGCAVYLVVVLPGMRRMP